MLVLLLILFTTVLADSEEDKYIDLLPDEEKQQFLEKVARRILKDVESQEDVNDAQSGEVNDEQLKQHSEYVKSVLKEEQENIRRSKGEGKEKEEKPASEEEDLGVKPLASLKVSLFNERPDLTLREESRGSTSDKDSTNNITIEVVTDNAPIIKRSVQDDNVNKTNESDESTSETLNRVTNITSENVIKVETDNKKSENDQSDPKTVSDTGLEVVKSTNAGDVRNGVKPVEEHNDLNKSDTQNVSDKSIREGSRRSNNNDSILVDNVTESTTFSAVETVKNTVIKSDEYNNVSSANEEFTTVTYPFELTSANGNDTVATSTEGLVVESTTETITNEDTEPIMKSSIDDSKDTKNEADLTHANNIRISTSNDQEAITSILGATTLVPETMKNIPNATVDTKIIRTEAITEPTTLITTEQIIESKPVNMTKEPQIIVEDFPSASTISAIVESKILKPKKPITITKLPKEITTAVPESEQSIEVTTKKTINHKIFVHKPSKRIVGPKAKKIAENDDIQNQNFIELEKVYYNDNNNVKVGKEYHVFEVPADQPPFIKHKEPMAEQPYFVPIYNYSPNNAYYNPKNRLGPNPGDSSNENIFNDDENLNQLDRTETLNVKMEYDSLSNHFDSKRKKFGSKHKLIHAVNLQPIQIKEPKVPQGQVNPADYLDSDYYFGRVRKLLLRKANEDLNKFPNSDETDHPAHSIQEGSLKDHVRAVRNILFQQKSFGLVEKDKYESIERLGLGRKQSKTKEDNTLRKGLDENMKIKKDGKRKNKATDSENQIAIDSYIGREKPIVVTDVNQDGLTSSHFQKIGYLKKQNDAKSLYVMDDIFKANVEKYIEEKNLTPAGVATLLPKQVKNPIVLDKRKEIIALLRLEERKHKTEKKLRNAMKKDIENEKNIPTTTKTAEEVLDLKVNVRRNDVVKVSVYLQVLNDMVTLDNKALVQYDWLGTTVDIQASLQKLFELTSLVVNEEDVHPADIEILKYVLFLHKLASEIIEANNFGTQLRNKLTIPKNKKKKALIQKEKGLINKVWLYLRKEVPEVDEHGALNQLNMFLMDLEDSLYDLHDAIKNIAKITKYKNQHWYQNLKDLYIDTDEKHLLELLLHMSALRLFSLIEESAKNGLEDDYVQYMKKNRKHCKQTLSEIMFVMELLEEYNKFVEQYIVVLLF